MFPKSYCNCCEIRCVPPFSYQLLQNCTWAVGPPKIPIYRRQPPCHSLFRKFFLRGDVPISRYYGPQASRQFIKWHVPPEKLDYQRYLPLFFDGLCETAFPYREFARNGIRDMIAVAKEKQLLCCLPMLILPAKRALNSKDPDVIIATLRALQQLVQAGPWIGPALVPYYRQLLAIPNLFVAFNVNIGDQIDFQGGNRLGDVIDETLVLLERTGGRDAYLNIKYMVPTYESRVLNSPRETVQVIYPVKTVEKKLQTQSERREDIEESVQRKHSDTSRKQREDLNARKREYALILKTEKKSTPKYNEAAARKHAELGHEHVAEDLVLKMVESDKKAYPALTDEQRGVVERVLIGESPSEVIISKFNISITRNDLTTLLEDNWLNDQVINFYMNLLMERSELRANEGLPRVYAMNTFFMPKLLSAGHSDLKQWTQKVDIFTYDIIPVPVHVDANHWCMAIIDLRNRAIRYYDSKGTPNYAVLNLNALEQYLRDESLDKRNQPFDTSGFRKEIMREYALQTNDSDCGVFCCMFAEHETRNQPIGFGQMHMAYFRQKMIYEIAQGRLLT